MVWSIYTYPCESVETMQIEVGGIPCLRFRPKSRYDKLTVEENKLIPTVIFYHGWHSSKEFKRFESMVLASHGVQVFVPDALHHGEREAVDHDAPNSLETYFWSSVNQNITESGDLIQGITSSHAADPARIGIMGESMGAVSAIGVYGEHPDLACLVTMNGAYDWLDNIQRFGLMPGTPEQREHIRRFDPGQHAVRYFDRSMLFIHGKQDSKLPIEPQLEFFKYLKQQCKDTTCMEFVTVDGVDHHITTGMLERATMWFKENL